MDGPTIRARLSIVSRALLAMPISRSSRARLGRYAASAGAKNADAVVDTMASATIVMGGAPVATSTASTTITTARTPSVRSMIVRRSKRSASTPAGTESRAYGTTRAAPIRPSRNGSSATS